jgi:hypothetical protein
MCHFLYECYAFFLNFLEKRFSGPDVLGVAVAGVPIFPGSPVVAGILAVGGVRDVPDIAAAAAVDLAIATSQSLDPRIPLRLLVSLLLFLLLA